MNLHDTLHALKALAGCGDWAMPLDFTDKVRPYQWRMLARYGLVDITDQSADDDDDLVEANRLTFVALGLRGDACPGPLFSQIDPAQTLAERATLALRGMEVRGCRDFNGVALWTIVLGHAAVEAQEWTRHYETAAWYRTYSVPAQKAVVTLVVQVDSRRRRVVLSQGDGTSGARPRAQALATLTSGCMVSLFGGVPYGDDPVKKEIGQKDVVSIPVEWNEVEGCTLSALGRHPGAVVVDFTDHAPSWGDAAQPRKGA
jgi:hypothetical protein